MNFHCDVLGISVNSLLIIDAVYSSCRLFIMQEILGHQMISYFEKQIENKRERKILGVVI